MLSWPGSCPLTPFDRPPKGSNAGIPRQLIEPFGGRTWSINFCPFRTFYTVYNESLTKGTTMRNALAWMGAAFLSMLFLGPLGPIIIFTVWLTVLFTQKHRSK